MANLLAISPTGPPRFPELAFCAPSAQVFVQLPGVCPNSMLCLLMAGPHTTRYSKKNNKTPWRKKENLCKTLRDLKDSAHLHYDL